MCNATIKNFLFGIIIIIKKYIIYFLCTYISLLRSEPGFVVS